MKIIDAIIRMQQLDPNADLRIDLTDPNTSTFKFGNSVFFNEIETDEDGAFVVVSSSDMEEEYGEPEGYIDPKLN